MSNLEFSEIENMRIGLSQAGPVPNAVLYNNAAGLANAMVASGIDLILPAGVMVPYAGATEPTGWLFCYGQTLNSVTNTQYARLWAAIGTTYGGASSSSFILPDLRGRAPHGKDNMGGTAVNRVTNAVSGITGTTLGAVGGNQNMHLHTHIQNSHYHHFRAWLVQTNGNYGGFGYFANLDVYGYDNFDSGNYSISSATATNQNAGTGSSQNMPPTIITNYIIKL